MKITNDLSYCLGFILGDGHISSEKYRLSIELSSRDEDIIYKIKEVIDYEFKVSCSISTRTRDTQFKKSYQSIILRLNSKPVISTLVAMGIPKGKKSETISKPSCDFSEIDLIRGYIDSDGSLGLTANNRPFISAVISSDSFKDFFLDFILRNLGIKKSINRNTRDNVYNVFMSGKNALRLIKLLYGDNKISLDRKSHKALEMLSTPQLLS